PYKIYGGLSFYQRKEIKDIVAYFRMTVNPHDEEALKRIINYPSRGIGDTTLRKIGECATKYEVSLWQVVSDPLAYALSVNNGTLDKLKKFKELIDSFREAAEEKNAFDLAEQIVKQSGIFAEVFSDRTPENLSRQENLQELMNGVQEFCSLREEEGNESVSLIDFLNEISLATDQDNDKEENNDKVTMMTVHASKGLEFTNVFVVGLEEDLFPSAMCKSSEREIEEERRLLYVAITRAEKNCILSYAGTRYRNGSPTAMPPSRFLKDMDSRYLSLPSALDGDERPERREMNRFSSGNVFGCVRSRQWSDGQDSVNLKVKKSALYNPEQYRSLTRMEQAVSKETSGTLKQIGNIQVGSVIRHDRFGQGEVIDISGDGDNAKIGVEFENVGKKQLLLKFAKFTVVE
ncbi:MAG TPA: ATP-dependent DNA helicase, partial [Coprobacter fastidiosus]|nr:ATP-dependent DNA helicase [Coprobacter fastidiosus]